MSEELKIRKWTEFCGDCAADGSPIMHNEAHPGFAAVQSKIEGEGYGKKAAGAILASASRNASASAKKANPKLKKV